jgi:hypothetical protein
MSFRLQGTVAAFLLIAGCGTWSAMTREANYKPAKASVFLIERKCDIIETTKTADGLPQSTRVYKDDCKSVDAWEEAKEKRDKGISAKAVVKVSYTAPQDGSYQTSELKFTSRDDEFYDLKAGDEIDILVSNSDPTKITKA